MDDLCCSCEYGHALLCSVHAEEAAALMSLYVEQRERAANAEAGDG